MERFQEARNKAIRHLKTADHMLGVTYPLVQDTKLLVGVMDSIFLSLTNAMSAIVWYDRLFKRIPPFQDTFESKFAMFQAKSARKYNIENEVIQTIQDIKEIIIMHRKSPVEFRRKDRYIICGDDYSMKAITADQIKEYIKKTKDFVRQMDIITSKNERIFR
jgi:hypothetical protein